MGKLSEIESKVATDPWHILPSLKV